MGHRSFADSIPSILCNYNLHTDNTAMASSELRKLATQLSAAVDTLDESKGQDAFQSRLNVISKAKQIASMMTQPEELPMQHSASVSGTRSSSHNSTAKYAIDVRTGCNPLIDEDARSCKHPRGGYHLATWTLREDWSARIITWSASSQLLVNVGDFV